MKIKELENLLSISRSNVRFYEKQGLFSPERKDNNYREYTNQDIEVLKKIIIFRKMGFTVEEIKLIQNNDLPFAEAIANAQRRIEDEIEQLNGSLKLIKQVAQENLSFDEIDIDEHWNTISESEKSGEKFVDICKDFLELELNSFDAMWKYVFFHDFKRSRAKHGTVIACGILLLLCVLRGIGKVLIWKESFWSGFLYPFVIALAASIIILPLFLLSKKFPKVASVIATILLGLIVLFFAGIIILIIYSIIA
ncbi:MAG: MerR family transcriptional regulator [Clostridia bacterium]|nr:MerR family transcriptional regulator [Clostridia bacterium]